MLTEGYRVHLGRPILYQVVLEHVYLSVLLCIVGSAALVVDDRGGTVVLVFGGVRVEDVHGALFLGLWGLCLVLDLLLRLILREESVGFGTGDSTLTLGRHLV